MSQKLIARERLINLLQNNLEKNLIFIYSPPGYGKTALVQSFLERQNWGFAWLNVTPELNHIHTFFKYLIYSLQRVNPSFGINTIKLIESRGERLQLTGERIKAIVNEIMTTFVSEFKDVFKKDVILVIDDFHNLDESKWVNEAFNSLFNSLPGNLHLILISRQIPNLNFLPLMEKENMLRVGMEDLIFRFDEIAELLKKVYSIDYSDDGVRLLENNLGGWITGIHLILQSFGKDFTSIKVDLQRIPENIFNLLAEEIFRRLEPETQEFLLFTSLLDSFDADICRVVLGIKNSDKIIDSLVSKNLFIQPTPASDGTGVISEYNYQVLFKAYLNSIFNKSYSQEKAKQILKKVSGYYLERNDIISAVNYLIKIKDYQASVPLIVKNFDNLLAECEFKLLWKWLTEIESESEIRNPYLTFYLGKLYKYFIGDLHKSLEYLEAAVKSFRELNDVNGLIKSQTAKVKVLLNLGRIKEVISELTEQLNSKISGENKAFLLYLLAFAHYRNSEYDKAVQLIDEVLKHSDNGKKIGKEANVFNLLGHIELIKGDFKKSANNYEKALEKDPDVITKFETLCNLVLLNSQKADYAKAKEYQDTLDQMIKDFPTPVFKVPYMLSRQAYLYETGNYEENVKVLCEIRNIASIMNHKRYHYLCSRLLADSYHYLKNVQKAKEFLEMACKLVDEDNELEKTELSVMNILLNSENGISDSELNTLLNSYEFYSKNNYIYPQVQLGYRIARYFLKKGDTGKAKQYLDESLCNASKNGYVSFFIREYKHSKDLLDFALNNNMQKDFLNTVMTQN